MIRRGLDDGTERLRGQFRDAAQGERSGEDYGGDRIEDTAVGVPRQAVRGAEQIVRQMQRSKGSKTATSYPQPESEMPIDHQPDVGDSTPTVQPAPPVDPQPRDSGVTPPVRAREPVVEQGAAEHPPIKEKSGRIAVSEKPSAAVRVSQDGPDVKTRGEPVTAVPQDIHCSLQCPHTQPASNSYSPAVGDSQAIVEDLPAAGPQPRGSKHPPPVQAREPAAPQRAERPAIKEKTEQISVAEKPAITVRASQDKTVVKLKEPAIASAPQDVNDSQAVVRDFSAVGPRPKEQRQAPSDRAKKPVAAGHLPIKEKAAQPSISEKPAFTTRVQADGQSVKAKERTVPADNPPRSLKGVKSHAADCGKGTTLSVAPENGTIQTGPAVSQQIHAEAPAVKEHTLPADIKTRPDISQLPIRTREVEQAAESKIQISAISAGKSRTSQNVRIPAKQTGPKRIYTQPAKAVRETGFRQVQPDTRAMKPLTARSGPLPEYTSTGIKERAISSRSKVKIKKNKSAIGRPAQKTVKSTNRSVQTARKFADQIIQTRRRMERARQTLHTAGTIVKRSAEAAVKALQVAGAALKGVLSAAIAGGGITVAVVLVICLAGFLLASPLGMFFSDEVNTGPAIQDTIVQLNGEFTNRIEQIKEENPYDVLDLDNAGVTTVLSNWRDVLAVYAVRVTTDSANPSDVLTLTAEKQAILRATFWDMSVVNFETEIVSGTDRLHIMIITKNALQMADEYGFTADQRKLLEEMLSPAYQEFFQQLTGNFRNITLTAEQIQQIMDNLPASLSAQRKQVILTAYQLLGKVNYFWGGKSLVLGWDSRWGTPREVTAADSPSSGTVRPYGLDCSGFVDWVFYNVSNGGYVIGHGGGARMQHRHCTNISWSQAIPGDLVFYPEDTHVGIVCGFDEGGNVLIIHCASGANNVVVTGRGGFTSIARPNYYSE